MAAEPCVLCARLAQPPGDDGVFVAELSESVVILADDQFYEGYCIVLLRGHAEHLDTLEPARQAGLWNDVAAVAAALRAVVAPARINYECLGNLVGHVHWHVIPRSATDERRHEPIWLRPAEERHGRLSPERRRELAATLRRALTAARP